MCTTFGKQTPQALRAICLERASTSCIRGSTGRGRTRAMWSQSCPSMAPWLLVCGAPWVRFIFQIIEFPALCPSPAGSSAASCSCEWSGDDSVGPRGCTCCCMPFPPWRSSSPATFSPTPWLCCSCFWPSSVRMPARKGRAPHRGSLPSSQVSRWGWRSRSRVRWPCYCRCSQRSSSPVAVPAPGDGPCWRSCLPCACPPCGTGTLTTPSASMVPALVYGGRQRISGAGLLCGFSSLHGVRLLAPSSPTL